MSEKDKDQEVKLVMGDKTVPADLLVYKDPERGERVWIRKGEEYVESTEEPKEPVWIHKLRNFSMGDAKSFIAAVNRYGSHEKGVIFYTAEKITMFFDAMNREEGVYLDLEKSLELKAFFGAEGRVVIRDQKNFLKVLETYPECVSNAVKIRAMVERLQMSKEIKFESNLDPDNITFIYTEKGGQQEGRLPKKLTLNLPYFEGSGNRVTIEADLDIEMPKSDGERPEFKLEDVKYARTEKDALTAEVSSLQASLAEWLFLNGTC